MIKKMVVAALGAGLLSVVFLGRDAASYVCTSFGWVKDSVKGSVPIEFEIERARRLIKDLTPEIRKNMHVIAQEEVELERLDQQIVQATQTLDKDRTEIMRLKDDLSTPKVSYQYAGRTFTFEQVKLDLSNRFDRYKTRDDMLASLRDIQLARRKSLDAARQKLENTLVSKRKLEVEVENLEAKFKMVEVAQTANQHHIDDTQLGRVRELIMDLRTRLNVAERIANSTSEFDGEINLGTPPTDSILDQVTEYFHLGSDAEKLADAQASQAR